MNTTAESKAETLTRLDHVAICVHDLEQAISWYQTSFSCELIYRDNQQAVLQFLNTKIALVMPSFQRSHLAFDKSDANTFGEIRELNDGTHSTFISDASGNITELVETKNV